MFISLRRIERWLHQHIFKVGWLVTHNYQTTTILYYTVFLPGVILHEVVYWLVAGALNVRAERAIQWPEQQEIGELKLNFVKLSPRAGIYRKAIISIAPLIVGMVLIWLIANSVFNIFIVLETMSTGELTDFVEAIAILTQATDFWLWVYVIFTISNTMFPTVPKDLQGWRFLVGAGVAVAVALMVIGIGIEIFEAVSTSLNSILTTLQVTLVLMMCIDVVMVLVLGTIEYTIERITGNTATFKGGKMLTMTREEALEERRKEAEREQRRRERERKQAERESTPVTIYAISFPIAGAPGDIPITDVEAIEPTTEPIIASASTGTSEPATNTAEAVESAEDMAARINLPSRSHGASESGQSPTTDSDEVANVDDDVQSARVKSQIKPFGVSASQTDAEAKQTSATSDGETARQKPVGKTRPTSPRTTQSPSPFARPIKSGDPTDPEPNEDTPEETQADSIAVQNQATSELSNTDVPEGTTKREADVPKEPLPIERPASRITPPSKTTESSTDDTDKTSKSRFAGTLFNSTASTSETASSSTNEDEKQVASAADETPARTSPSRFAASRFRRPGDESKSNDRSDDTQTNEETNSPIEAQASKEPAASRFSPTSQTTETDPEESTDETRVDVTEKDPKTKSSRFASSRFSSTIDEQTAEESSKTDSAESDTNQHNFAVRQPPRFTSSRFASQRDPDTTDSDDSSKETDDSNSRISPFSVTGSQEKARPATPRFSSSRFSRNPDDEEDTDDQPAKPRFASSRFSRQANDETSTDESPATPRFSSSRFSRDTDSASETDDRAARLEALRQSLASRSNQTSSLRRPRPVPKPTAANNEEDDQQNEEITYDDVIEYEDIDEDYVDYDEDEDYISYDDD